MIRRPDIVQMAILALMKSQPELVSLVGNEIREDYWMGTKFDYPNLRVAVDPYGPPDGMNGPCRELMAEISFTVYAYWESTSSQECGKLIGTVAQVLMGKQL